jgi:anaerobic selenocysteine-containing dehydrogenase
MAMGTRQSEQGCPKSLREDPDMADGKGDVLLMITLRSNDQFNTTIYGYDDRFRGIHGTRSVALMNSYDVARLGLAEGEEVTISTVSDDGVDRKLGGLKIVTYNIPRGCIGTYYPEANVLIPLWHHAERSKVPAAKSVPVRVYGTFGLPAIKIRTDRVIGAEGLTTAAAR